MLFRCIIASIITKLIWELSLNTEIVTSSYTAFTLRFINKKRIHKNYIQYSLTFTWNLHWNKNSRLSTVISTSEIRRHRYFIAHKGTIEVFCEQIYVSSCIYLPMEFKYTRVFNLYLSNSFSYNILRLFKNLATYKISFFMS